MEITPTTITLVGVVCVALGILAGLLINSLMDGGDDQPAATDEAPPGGRKGKYTPVFRVWREKQAGTLVVEMDGKAMTSPEPLNEIQRERLERTVRDLRAWLGMGLAVSQPAQAEERVPSPSPAAIQSIAGAQSTAAAQNAPADPKLAEGDDLNRVFGAAPTSIPPKPAQPAPPPVSVSRPSVSARSAAVPPIIGKGKDEPVIAPAAKSMVLQIEDILQDMIAGTELERRGVHLAEDPIRGVIVQVGAERFEGIGAVTDPQVRDVIQMAVQEWEKSQ